MHAVVAGREIAAVGPHPAPDRRLSRTLDADERTEREAVRQWLLQPDLEPVIALDPLIQQQPCGPAVVRDDDVDVAVVVDVAEGRPAADFRFRQRRPGIAVVSSKRRPSTLWNN